MLPIKAKSKVRLKAHSQEDYSELPEIAAFQVSRDAGWSIKKMYS